MFPVEAIRLSRLQAINHVAETAVVGHSTLRSCGRFTECIRAALNLLQLLMACAGVTCDKFASGIDSMRYFKSLNETQPLIVRSIKFSYLWHYLYGTSHLHLHWHL